MTAQHSLDWHQTRTAAETVPCPYCRAPVGRTCRNKYTGQEVSFPAHPDRVKLSADRPTATHSEQIADLDREGG
ncbi:hypothetical protein SEA_TIAMOCELI_54 [Gordonia phage Tiamoceli]|uniref:DNA-binding phage zinc finger domain-containing protein n=1 Tax=Gordonia phage Tiamoceli TaxID=2510508 RepID=A0A411CSG4_9CAUD|nr:hypothetical protein J1598_gp54 [Gordonia phage Tiamoceli]QAY16798.1 hypothetical protein SEA_TIAMOCELI_54 [Gordonia phage Tiamoceli]